ncbi:VOC family protein [Herpetosiphon gulosus]|uniref:VOC domain-containing protein n=1 Tax=Herpetosiphon gulosus TaxID=1973496 RepID=A0ABP9WXI8_9CHLR
MFDMIGIVVADMAKALDFYRLFDLDLPSDPGGEDHVETTLPNGMRLAWDSQALMKQLQSDWQEPRGHRMGLAFKCASPAAVDQLYAKILAAGYRGSKDPWDAFWGQRYAVVLDPDGNLIDLFAPLD